MTRTWKNLYRYFKRNHPDLLLECIQRATAIAHNTMYSGDKPNETTLAAAIEQAIIEVAYKALNTNNEEWRDE